jgi:hypothetical protein
VALEKSGRGPNRKEEEGFIACTRRFLHSFKPSGNRVTIWNKGASKLEERRFRLTLPDVSLHRPFSWRLPASYPIFLTSLGVPSNRFQILKRLGSTPHLI